MNVITHEALLGWLDALAAETTLIAPRQAGGVVRYGPVDGADGVAWGFTRPALSVKEAFFPPTDRLIAIERLGGDIRLAEIPIEGKQIIFGVRPCDAKGVLALDALFLETPPVDPHYARRREGTTLVGLSCTEMGPSCFCTAVGGAPDDATGMDLMLYEVAVGYAVEAITPKGEALLAGMPVGDGSADRPAPPVQTPNVQLPAPEAWPAHFESDYWAATAERCIGCRICAYVCPTCRCFDVRDEPVPSDNGRALFERVRCWDSCTGQNYRRIAGGHNPREAKGERLRNRFLCKFHYYPQQVGPLACTGCGRCVDACPVNIDITEVMRDLAEMADAPPEVAS